jgi:anaphase-promoting complex subunit 11
MKVDVVRWDAVGTWRWCVPEDEEDCSICHQPFDSSCSDCKSPGDDCPLVWGACGHSFHLHCILKWTQEPSAKGQCPLDRKDWRFKGEGEEEEKE